MNLSLSTLIVIFLFVLPIIFILYHTFRDKIKSPFLLRVFSSITVFALLSLLGAALSVHFLENSRIIQTCVITITMLSEMLIFYIAVDYKLVHALFIASVVKCYADNVTCFLIYCIISSPDLFPSVSPVTLHGLCSSILLLLLLFSIF